MDSQEFQTTYQAIQSQIAQVLVGQEDVLHATLVALLGGGHVLLEGAPGLGKTLLVRILSQVLGLHSQRIQFTPDLMPSDVTGNTVYNAQSGTFEFRRGPIFAQLVLADEINRAPAKTQAAMLEAMAEGGVTADGGRHALPSPFFVLATQNPIESAGTYPLPEAQLDRFLFKVNIHHPSHDEEVEILRRVRDGFDAAALETSDLAQVVGTGSLLGMQDYAKTVRAEDSLLGYISHLVSAARQHSAVEVGASPRASIGLLRAGQVEAAALGRDFVTPDDIKCHASSVFVHRLLLHPDAELEGVRVEDVVREVLDSTPVPGMQ